MLLFTPCKINLGLRIAGKRPDGYHNLESIFFPVPWYDALEMVPSNKISITVSGAAIPGPPEHNLCVRAWHLLKADFPTLPAVDIYLHKTIPTGAGLGGGSSNGAFMLAGLNRTFNLHLTKSQLAAYALALGSDCPFFIDNQPALATGRGEVIAPLPLTLTGYTLVLINPGIHIPTAWAFAQITPRPPQLNWEAAAALPPAEWEKAGIVNDFEAPVFKTYPAIAQIKTTLLQAGADFAALTGTGSTCFGLFRHPPVAIEELFPPPCIYRQFTL